MDPMMPIDHRHQVVSVVFHMEADSYQEAREKLADFLMGAPPDYARQFGLRAMVVAEFEEADPSAVTFSMN